MLKFIYFLLLFFASAEDYKYHTVKSHWVISVFLLGLLNIITKENRWVTLALTCACFMVLLLVYKVVAMLAVSKRTDWKFGGADVRLVPGMMLVQGWDIALMGIFIGFISVLVYYLVIARERKAIPLVPWMTAGCFAVEVVLFVV